MKAIRCDYCGNIIKFGDSCISQSHTCGMYCSFLCCARDQMDVDVYVLDEEAIDNRAHSNDVFELEEQHES